MGKAQHVTERDFEQEVVKSTIPVVADFWAIWCGPCRMIAPIIEELATEYEGKIKVVKIDVDENPDIAVRYNIMSIPTIGVFRDGEMVGRIVGFVPKPELKKRIEAALAMKVS